MATTFKKVNAVTVDLSFSRVHDAALDAGLATGGVYAGNLAAVGAELSTQASVGACYKGMPVAIASGTGTIVPINQASTAAAKYFGVLTTDITPARAAIPRRVTCQKSGRVRSYAGAAGLVAGQPVKADTSAAFSGFVAFVVGTDTPDLLAGYAYPLTDGIAIAQGDIIFVELA